MKAATAAVASAMKAGTSPTGIETSCLIEPPCGFCASDIASRKRQNASRCSSVAASAASAISSRSSASPSRAVKASSRPFSCCALTSISAYHGCALGERIARARIVGEHEFHADARHQLEAGDLLAEALARHFQQRQRVLRIGEADEGGRARARPGEQLQRRGGDDPQRALGADEQVLEIVAGVVLAQLGKEIGDAPVGEHDLDAERQVARVAIGDDRDAAGVGGEIAADRGGCLPKRAPGETAGRPPRPPPGLRRASRPLRRSSRWRRRRPRGCGSSASATAAARRRWRRELAADQPGLPPCGTIATPAAAQAATTAETSAVEPGRATAIARPRNRPRGSSR